MSSILTCKNLSKSFGNKKAVRKHYIVFGQLFFDFIR